MPHDRRKWRPRLNHASDVSRIWIPRRRRRTRLANSGCIPQLIADNDRRPYPLLGGGKSRTEDDGQSLNEWRFREALSADASVLALLDVVCVGFSTHAASHAFYAKSRTQGDFFKRNGCTTQI